MTEKTTPDNNEVAEETEVPSVTKALAAQNKIKNYVIASMATSAVPVPLFDLAAVVAIQLRMIQKLSQLYGREFSESTARNIISALAGGVVSVGGGLALAASASKLIPGIGWMIGFASLPIVSGATTYALGQVIVNHFEGGGSLFDLRTEQVRDFYREQFEKGKKIAASLKKEQPSEAA